MLTPVCNMICLSIWIEIYHQFIIIIILMPISTIDHGTNGCFPTALGRCSRSSKVQIAAIPWPAWIQRSVSRCIIYKPNFFFKPASDTSLCTKESTKDGISETLLLERCDAFERFYLYRHRWRTCTWRLREKLLRECSMSICIPRER